MSSSPKISVRLFLAALLCWLPTGAKAEEPAADEWKHSMDCRLDSGQGGLLVTSTGVDPYLYTREVPKATGPFEVELLMKSDSAGIGQIYWTGRQEVGFHGSQAANFGVYHDSQWHRYRVFLPALDMSALRLDPSMAAGKIEIASVRLFDSDAKQVKQWTFGAGGPERPYPNCLGDAQIRGDFDNAPIVISTTARLAGAIHSLQWKGREFIDSADHGRQLQSATNLDLGTPNTSETYNPTEAGSRDDGGGPFSSSRLLSLTAQGPELRSVSQMAFWLRPGEKSGPNLAKNTTIVSNHWLSKRVHIGHKALPNVIEYDVSFPMPAGEKHTLITLEALTGYMPFDFHSFRTFDPAAGEVATTELRMREQPLPLIFSTEDELFAMGIFAPDEQPEGTRKASYGVFQFDHEKVVKWNCVYRDRNPEGLARACYSYNLFVVIGSVGDVRNAMRELVKEFPPSK